MATLNDFFSDGTPDPVVPQATFDTHTADAQAHGITAYASTVLASTTAGEMRLALGLDTAATTSAADYATAAQGLLADSSLQPGADLTALAATAVTAGFVLVADGLGGIAWAANTATPSGGAGGVLSGTYPNPGFAVDMATQGELDGHTGTTSGAHGISAFGATLIDDAAAAAARTTLGLGTAATTASVDYATAAQGGLADTALQSGALLTELSSAGASNSHVPIADGLGGITWGAQSGGGGAALSNANPAALGTADPGASIEASRSDHVHPVPTLDTLGLAEVSQAEAEAGVEIVARRWSAQRVAQAIAALAPAGGGGSSSSVIAEFIADGTSTTMTLAVQNLTEFDLEVHCPASTAAAYAIFFNGDGFADAGGYRTQMMRSLNSSATAAEGDSASFGRIDDTYASFLHGKVRVVGGFAIAMSTCVSYSDATQTYFEQFAVVKEAAVTDITSVTLALESLNWPIGSRFILRDPSSGGVVIPTKLSAMLTMSVDQTSLVANTTIAFDQSEGNITFDAITGRFTIPANRAVCGSITVGVGMSGSTQGSNYRIYDVTNGAYIPLSSGNRYAVAPTTFGSGHRTGVTGGQFRLAPGADTVYEWRLAQSGSAATINSDRTSVTMWSVD